MKILITGGAGFIGSHLAERLLNENHEVLVIDNYETGRRDNLLPHKNLKIIEGNIADADLVHNTFHEFKPDNVVHAAASYKNPDNWEEDTFTNIYGTINIVKTSLDCNVKRLIYFQTSLCYGLKPVEQPITMNHPLFSGEYSGGSSYAISKTAGEQYIELSGIDFISFRLANAYGPRNLSGPLPAFFQRLVNNLPVFVMDTRRDFIFIEDLIEVVLKALNGVGIAGYYHISTGKDYAIKELFDLTVKELGVKLNEDVEVRPRSENDVSTILIDPSKTIEDFNWSAKTTLEIGVKKAIEWYKNNDISQTYTHLKSEDSNK